MKKIIVAAITSLLCLHCMAQEQLAFPFQGGKDIMTRFFKDSLEVSDGIIQKKATGSVILKFTADTKGSISKIIVYYAEDAVLVACVIDAIKKSNHKWVIPAHEKYYDFILPVIFAFNKPPTVGPDIRKAVYDYNRNHKAIFSTDQIPLNLATLLPAVMVNYDLPHL